MSTDDLTGHWLLSLASETPVNLHQVIPAVHALGLNVKPIPGCDSRDYANGILQLSDAGMIELSSESPSDDVRTFVGVSEIVGRFLKLSEDDPRIVPLSSRVNAPRPPELKVTYRLTALGGAAWEQVAKPNWTDFVTGTEDDHSGELISAHKDRLLAYMGWSPELSGSMIRLDTIKWETHTDFNIVYWKRLRTVHRVSFELERADKRWRSGSGPKWFWDWYFSTRNWFTRPWDLPEWPSR